MTFKTFYTLFRKDGSKEPAFDDDNYLFDTEAVAIDMAQGLFDVRPVKRWVRADNYVEPPYLPGFVPNAADRHYGAAISKLLRENEARKNEALAHAAAIRMIRDAIEELFGPYANLESEEAVLLRGPEPHHDAESIIQALTNMQTQFAANGHFHD